MAKWHERHQVLWVPPHRHRTSSPAPNPQAPATWTRQVSPPRSSSPRIGGNRLDPKKRLMYIYVCIYIGTNTCIFYLFFCCLCVKTLDCRNWTAHPKKTRIHKKSIQTMNQNSILRRQRNDKIHSWVALTIVSRPDILRFQQCKLRTGDTMILLYMKKTCQSTKNCPCSSKMFI